MQSIYEFGAKYILIVNLPPLGCAPALLTTYYQDSASNYDGYGCMKNTNRISKYHNTLLEDSVNDLRDTMRDAKLYFADINRVHKEVLRMPSDYGIHFTLGSLRVIRQVLSRTCIQLRSLQLPQSSLILVVLSLQTNF